MIQPSNFRAVPIDPESRLPADVDVSTHVQYDFGHARPHKVLRSVPGQRGMVDKNASMRRDLHSDFGAEGNIRSNWGREQRLGDDTSPRRPSTASGGGGRRRSNSRSGRQQHRHGGGTSVYDTLGRSASGAFVHDHLSSSAFSNDTLSRGITQQHLSSSDIGAGTQGDSMVAHFPRYDTPLTAPFAPQLASIHDTLTSSSTNTTTTAEGGQQQPIHPALFTRGIEALRQAAVVASPAIAGSSSGGMTRSQARRVEDENERRRRETQDNPSTTKEEIEKYLNENQRLKSQYQPHESGVREMHMHRERDEHHRGSSGNKRPSTASSRLYTTHEERVKAKYQAKVDKLERALLTAKKHAEKDEKYERENRLDQMMYSESDSTRHDSSRHGIAHRNHHHHHPSGSNDSERERDRDLLLGTTEGRQKDRLQTISSSLRSGAIDTIEFPKTLNDAKKQHSQNLKELEQVYYQQKITSNLAQRLVQTAATQRNSQEMTAIMQQFQLQQQQQQQQQQHPQGQHHHHHQQQQQQQQQQVLSDLLSSLTSQQRIDFCLSHGLAISPTDLAAINDPKELAFLMSQKMKRSAEKTAQKTGLADEIEGDNSSAQEKKRLAATFQQTDAAETVVDDDDDGEEHDDVDDRDEDDAKYGDDDHRGRRRRRRQRDSSSSSQGRDIAADIDVSSSPAVGGANATERIIGGVNDGRSSYQQQSLQKNQRQRPATAGGGRARNRQASSSRERRPASATAQRSPSSSLAAGDADADASGDFTSLTTRSNSGSGGHDIRQRRAAADAEKHVNRAHAFGPGKLFLDAEGKPMTVNQVRERSRSRSRPRTATTNTTATNDDFSGEKSRTKARFLEYLAEVKARESAPLESPPFRANPLPVSTLEPRYERMVADQKERSKQLRRERKQMTQQMVKPFKFEASKAVEAKRKERNRSRSRSRSRSRTRSRSRGRSHTRGGNDDDDDSIALSEQEEKTNHPARRGRSRSRSRPAAAARSGSDINSDVDVDVDRDDKRHGDHIDDDDDDDASTLASAASYKVAFGSTHRPSSSPSGGRRSDSHSPSSSPHHRADTRARRETDKQKPAFKANKVPWTSSVNLLDGLLAERERKRQENVKKRAEQLLAESKLPRRMKMHAESSKAAAAAAAAGSTAGTDIDNDKHHHNDANPDRAASRERIRAKRASLFPEPSFKPELKGTIVPDFDRLHAEFEGKLTKVKKSKSLTQPMEFSFLRNSIDKEAERDRLRRQLEAEAAQPFRAKPYIPSPPPAEEPQSTAKLEQMRELTRLKLEAREKAAAEEAAAREAKLKSKPEIAKKLIPKIASLHSHGASTTEEKIKQLTRAAKKDIQQKDADWAARVEEMKARVRQRPLLIESYNSAAARMEARRKALIAIKESLDKAGIVDQSRFFDAQELSDLDLHFF